MLEDLSVLWDLFKYSYLSGWLIGLLLSLVGVFVVARDQVFLGAAISQASTLGIALAIALGAWMSSDPFSWLHSETFPSALAVAFSVVAALLTARGGRSGQESREAVTGLVFLLSASLSVLLVAHSPHGLEEVHRLLFSTIIGATQVDVWVFGALAALTIACIAFFSRPLLLLTLDPVMASAVGMKVRVWTPAIYAWLGLSVGLSLKVSGLLYTFGCLVLPPLIAKNLTREVRSMFIVAPIIATLSAVIGLIVSHKLDFPPAQVTVALQGFLLPVAWAVKRYRG